MTRDSKETLGRYRRWDDIAGVILLDAYHQNIAASPARVIGQPHFLKIRTNITEKYVTSFIGGQSCCIWPEVSNGFSTLVGKEIVDADEGIFIKSSSIDSRI
jgi:hypothetical protein